MRVLFPIKVLNGLALFFLIASSSAAAETKKIDEAVNKYYAGSPYEAISMIEPIALSGDVDAQYVLGNILYSLSKTGKYKDIDDPVKWYKMAAEQHSAGANYALGVIFENQWRESRDEKKAASSIVYYQKAVELGNPNARSRLSKIKFQSKLSLQGAVALVGEMETTSIPKSKSVVEELKTKVDQPGKAGTQAPLDNTSTQNKPTEPSDLSTELETVIKESPEIAKVMDPPDDEPTITIPLSDIARQCKNYTEVGFGFYAETVKGALVSGKASMISIRPDSSATSAYSANFSYNQFGIKVFLNLNNVPNEVALGIKQGEQYAVTGILIDSKVVDSNCVLSAMYESIKS